MKLRRFGRFRATALLLGIALIACLFPASVMRADEPPPEPPKDAAPESAEPAPAETVPVAEPERISGKLHKVDAENKSITVIVEPERGRSGRAFKRYKLFFDDKSLILVEQQPSTIAALEAGQTVEVGYFKRGKQDVVDTVVVTGKAE